jgi:hypothetical protein
MAFNGQKGHISGCYYSSTPTTLTFFSAIFPHVVNNELQHRYVDQYQLREQIEIEYPELSSSNLLSSPARQLPERKCEDVI